MFVLGGGFFFMGIPRFRLKLFFRLTGAPPLLVSSFPLKVSQQSLRVANQRKSHNLELSFSIIHKLLGIITSFPVEDKNFYVVCFLLIFGPMGITWEGGRPNRWRHSHTMGLGREIQKTASKRGQILEEIVQFKFVCDKQVLLCLA